MKCHILKDKISGEEYLIPGCYGVSNTFGAGIEDMTAREIIKMYCHCNRPKVEKYETHTRDEVFSLIEVLEKKIAKQKEDLEKMESELDTIKSEVFMLNTVEVI